MLDREVGVYHGSGFFVAGSRTYFGKSHQSMVYHLRGREARWLGIGVDY